MSPWNWLADDFTSTETSPQKRGMQAAYSSFVTGSFCCAQLKRRLIFLLFFESHIFVVVVIVFRPHPATTTTTATTERLHESRIGTRSR